MKANEIFLILEIDETKDVNLVKQAYLKKVKTVNPEYNPEGFKKLREAYDAAVEYCQSRDDEAPEGTFEVSLVDLWIQKAEDIYKNMDKRKDIQKWEELLKDEVCYSLEYSLEAKDRMLRFLNEHTRLPKDIWKYINDYYEFDKNREEFYELCPKRFLDFLISQAESMEVLPFCSFEGNPEADYDLFIDYYYDLLGGFYDEDQQKIDEIISLMDKMDIRHPYYSGLKAVLRENWDEAVPIYQAILEDYSEHYLANRHLAHYHLMQKDYAKAKDYCIEALHVSSDDYMVEELKRINEGLLEGYKEKDISILETKDFLELGWIYLQNDMIDDGLTHLSSKSVEDLESFIDKAEYISLYAKMYFEQENYKEAVKSALQEEELLQRAAEELLQKSEDEQCEEEGEDGGTKKVEKRRNSNLGMISRLYQKIGELEENEDESKENYEKALIYVDKLLERGPDVFQNIYMKATVYKDLKEYEKAIEYCDKAISMDEEFFPAYIAKQEACSKLWDGQGVIDCFYGAKRIFAGYPKMYKLTMDVFLGVEQFDDAEDVYNQAREQDIVDEELELSHMKLLKRQDKDEEAFEKGKKLVEQFAGAAPEILADIYSELALCMEKTEKLYDAMDYIDKAYEVCPKSRIVWIKADIFLDMEKYEDALKTYEKCAEMDDAYKDWTLMSQRRAYCYDCMQDKATALELYEEAYDRDNENISALMAAISTAYSKFDREGYIESEKTEIMRYAEVALTQELDYRDSIALSNLLLCIGEPDKSLEACDLAIKADPEWWLAYNNKGCIYRRQNLLDKAEEFFLQSIEKCQDKEVLAYKNLSIVYQRLGQNQKNMEVCKKIIEVATELERLDVDNQRNWAGDIQNGKEELLDCYRCLDENQKALEYLEEVYDRGEGDYYSEKSSILKDMGEEKEALNVLLEAYKKFKSIFNTKKEGLPKLCENLGDFYAFHLDDYKTAEKYFSKSISAAKGDFDKMRGSLRSLMEIHFFSGNIKEAKAIKIRIFEGMGIDERDLERYISLNRASTGRLTDILFAFVCSGETETAEKYAKILEDKNGLLCVNCNHSGCWEYYEGLGMICEAKGQIEEAIALYKRAMEIIPGESLMSSRVRILSKR